MKNQSSKKISLRAIAMTALAVCVTATSLSANADYGPSYGNDRGGEDSIGFQNGRGGGPGYGRPGDGRGPGRGRDEGYGRGSRRGDFRDYREVERLVNLLYQGALFRYADPTGLAGFGREVSNRGAQGLFDSARMIGSSPELDQVVRRMGSRRVVENIYRVFFNRYPDPSGMENWSRLLDACRGGEALYGIVASQEFYENQLR